MVRRFSKHNKIALDNRLDTFISLLLLLSFFLNACDSSRQNTVVPTQEIVYPIDTVLQREAFQPDHVFAYKGLVPGKSTSENIIDVMGVPNVTKAYEKFRSIHYFIDYDPLLHGSEYFLLENDVLIAVTSNLAQGPNRTIVDVLSAQFPNAEIIDPPFGSPTYVLPQYGLAFTAYRYQYFVPMELEEYRLIWENYPITVDPFPIDNISLDDNEIHPGLTTQDDLAKLFGSPDRILAEMNGKRWLYSVESDTYGQLDVSIGESGIITDIIVENLEKSPTLLQALDQYGQPDIVQLMSVYTNSFDSISFVYLKRGLRLLAYCAIPNCQSDSLELIVAQKWYFPVMDLQAYQSSFPDAVFMSWDDFLLKNPISNP